MKAERISSLVSEAMMAMLSASIKPGVTDRLDASQRNVADFFNALTSIRIMAPWLTKIARLGIENVNISPDNLFLQIKAIAIKAESEVLKVTGNPLSFKGAFFFLSLCAAAAGRIISCNIYPDSNTVSVVAAEMANGICQRELETLDVKSRLIGDASLTPGERVYLKYGYTGARGEAENGLPTVMKHALPLMRKLPTEREISQNDLYVQVFLTLMRYTADTGIAAAENDLSAEEIQDRARGILERGGVLTPIGREKIEKLDRHLIERKFVPGAAASLLAPAIFLHSLDKEAKFKFL